jgi:hypothetical protein
MVEEKKDRVGWCFPVSLAHTNMLSEIGLNVVYAICKQYLGVYLPKWLCNPIISCVVKCITSLYPKWWLIARVEFITHHYLSHTLTSYCWGKQAGATCTRLPFLLLLMFYDFSSQYLWKLYFINTMMIEQNCHLIHHKPLGTLNRNLTCHNMAIVYRPNSHWAKPSCGHLFIELFCYQL